MVKDMKDKVRPMAQHKMNLAEHLERERWRGKGARKQHKTGKKGKERMPTHVVTDFRLIFVKITSTLKCRNNRKTTKQLLICPILVKNKTARVGQTSWFLC